MNDRPPDADGPAASAALLASVCERLDHLTTVLRSIDVSLQHLHCHHERGHCVHRRIPVPAAVPLSPARGAPPPSPPPARGEPEPPSLPPARGAPPPSLLRLIGQFKLELIAGLLASLVALAVVLYSFGAGYR